MFVMFGKRISVHVEVCPMILRNRLNGPMGEAPGNGLQRLQTDADSSMIILPL